MFVLRRGTRTIEIYSRDANGKYVREEIECKNTSTLLMTQTDINMFAVGNVVYIPGTLSAF